MIKKILFLILIKIHFFFNVGSSQTLSETIKLNNFLDSVYNAYLERHPMQQSYLGRKENYSLWDNYSDEQDSLELKIVKENLIRLNKFNIEKLDTQGILSFLLFRYNCDLAIAGEEFQYHNYPVNQLFGIQNEIPGFLINVHRIDSIEDAYSYLNRLDKVDELIVQVIQKLENRRKKGIIPPQFVFPKVIQNCNEILEGFPFQKGKPDCDLLVDFKKKIELLTISAAKKEELIGEAIRLLSSDFQGGYLNLISYLQELQKSANGNKGVWALPNGNAYYKYALKDMTTTDLTPAKIYKIGNSEVERIKKEMEKIKQQSGFSGSLKDFFNFLKSDKQFYFSNDSSGRAEYLKEVEKVIGGIKSSLPQLFLIQPKADLLIKPVEAYREKSTAAAFYEPAAPNGSRPGIYYINLHDMRGLPTFEIEALAYHEAIPGHHMQISIAQELDNLPLFRKYQIFSAYAEGWGLYAELLPKEIGFYTNAYSDFGRLSKELFRACRMVVDVGIHNKKWSREKAISYLMENTPNSEVDCIREVERYFILPGQATSYKVGMLQILRLRSLAEKSLREKFSLKEFHNVILTNGALPFPLVEKAVKEYIAKQ